MTGLLVSVRDAGEARDALEAGVDLIDIKEPRAGSLGAASPETIAEIIRVVGSRRPLSVALGELASGLADLPAILGAERVSSGIQFAKVGLAGCAQRTDWIGEWRRALNQLPPETSPVAVVYADWQIAAAPSPDEVIEQGHGLGCRAMLIDTFDKRGPGLFGVSSTGELRRLVSAARAADMLIVLGGQIIEQNLPDLLPLDPDVIAVRGAVCRGDRSGHLDPDRIRQFKRRLRPSASTVPFD